MATLLDDEMSRRLLGSTGTAVLVVTDKDTAQALGSGDLPVLGTPRMIALMEQAACAAVAGALPEGVTTVGVHLDVRHVRPSPIGASVTAAATVTAVHGDRVGLDVVASHVIGPDEVPIGAGQHTRAAVLATDFLARLDPQR